MKHLSDVLIGYEQLAPAFVQDLKGKTFLVTGASSGIGEMLTECLVRMGSTVFGVARGKTQSFERLQQALDADGLGPGLWIYPYDLCAEKAILRLQEELYADHGKSFTLHGLVNAASMLNLQPMEEMKPSTLEKMLKLNGTVPTLLFNAFFNNLQQAKKTSGHSAVNLLFSQPVSVLNSVRKLGKNPIPPGKDILGYFLAKFGGAILTAAASQLFADIVSVSLWPETVVDTAAAGGKNPFLANIPDVVKRKRDAIVLACLCIIRNAFVDGTGQGECYSESDIFSQPHLSCGIPLGDTGAFLEQFAKVAGTSNGDLMPDLFLDQLYIFYEKMAQGQNE